ncbi:MAG: protein kinase [Deltaproteobacteria bacterium]|nr:protein kinase [Deltaproteobacteria bacterium]
MKVALTVIKGPELGRVMEFTEPRGFIIGRAKDADFVIPKDDYISRRHVYLEICPPHCRLQDIGNTNPAHVNGEPFTERELADGDVVEVGYTQLRVSLSAQVTPRVWKCPRCGHAIDLLPGEADPGQCPACIEKQQREAQAAHARQPEHCGTCGADLTQRANSDGRAEELHEVAVYACEQCVPREGKSAGTMIDEYELCRPLGEGGFGTVSLVYHQPTARVLALKQMKDLKDEHLVKRFEREVRLLKGLAHPNVVRCIDTGVDSRGAPYLVTEYVPNESLEDMVIARGGQLARDFVLPLICDVLTGLEYIHVQSIIHRDIKPSNILLRHAPGAPARSTPTPKLADFGLAVSYARAGGTRVTKHGTGFGTLMYMSPQQVQDAGTVRESADTYAVGVTLYYLLTGKYSFDFPTPTEIAEFQKKMKGGWKKPVEALQALMQLRRILHPFQIILSEEPIPVQKRDPSLPRDLAAVVDKAVRKEAKARFQTAAEFRHALQQVVG